MSKAMFGCLKMLCIMISFYISASNSSVNLGSKIFFIATCVPFRNPLWITENPPWPICSPNSISLIETSLTPATLGSLPAVAETSEELYVNEAKFSLWISSWRSSTCFWSLFEVFCSFFNISSSFLTSWFGLPLAVVGRSWAFVAGLGLVPKFIQSRSGCWREEGPPFKFLFSSSRSLMRLRSCPASSKTWIPPKLDLVPKTGLELCCCWD